MNNRDLDFVRQQLKSAMPLLHDAELTVDLWPRMLRRMEHAPPAFGWFEAALVGLVAIALAVFPELLPAILYHL